VDLTPEIKAWIDAKTYGDLLHGWRFTPSGDKIFQGPSGDYWAARMKLLRDQGADHVGASKRLGWGNP